MPDKPLNLMNLAREKAEINRIFSNDKRLMIFWLLSKHEMSVNDLAVAVETTIQNISQHLRLMKAKNILESHRDGQSILYSVAESDIGQYCQRVFTPNHGEDPST